MKKEDLQNIITKGESETVEFKKSFNKAVLVAIAAFSNSKGGRILIGIDDDGNISGVKLSKETVPKWINEVKQNTKPQVIPYVNIVEIDDKNVVIIKVIEYPIKPVSYKDKFYKRVLNSNHQMSLTEIANEHLRTINSSWDYFPDPSHNLDHISIEKVNKYLKEYEQKNEIAINYSPITFLNKQEILKNGNLTFGAYLLFAKNLCIISDLQIGRFKSSTKIIDSLTLNTDIFTELNEIIVFVKKHLMVEYIITGAPAREERYDYPVEAIREVVINMLIHRDYRDAAGSIIKIFDDRIEFYNPGKLIGNITINDLLTDNYTSKPRNKLIAKAFREIGRIEKYGSGINRIINHCKDHGLIPPKFEEISNGFRVTLYKEKTDLKTDLKADLKTDLKTDEELIIALINENAKITIPQLAKKINKGLTVTKDKIRKLKNKNLIKRVGQLKGGHWEVI